MAPGAARFALDETVVYAGRRMRIAGLVRFEGPGGQKTTRYLLMEASGTPAIVEEGDGRFSLLRPFPAEIKLPATGSSLLVGAEKYTLVAVRRLTVLAAEGQAPGGAPRSGLLLSGVFEGPTGTLMREMAPRGSRQTYYLMKALGAGEVLSAAQHASARELAGRAAAKRAIDED